MVTVGEAEKIKQTPTLEAEDSNHLCFEYWATSDCQLDNLAGSPESRDTLQIGISLKEHMMNIIIKGFLWFHLFVYNDHMSP